jgi:hypothetical protein
MGDEPGGPPGDEGPKARSPRSYSIFVGVAFLALVAVATVNTLNTDSGGVLGTAKNIHGRPLPEFAVPAIPGPLEGDANVAQDDCETSENPCPEGDRRTPACEIRVPGAIRVCDLFDRPLVLSFWFTTPSGCPPTQDAVDAVARRYKGRVNFLSIAVRGDHDEIQSIAEDHGWTVPLGWDRDGAVSDIYRVGLCPTVAFAFPGGEFQRATVGADNVDARSLSQDVQRLLSASRARAKASG